MLVPVPEELLCRHCGLPADVDGATCYAALGDEAPHAYRVHLRCQEAALERLVAASRDIARRWGRWERADAGWRDASRPR